MISSLIPTRMTTRTTLPAVPSVPSAEFVRFGATRLHQTAEDVLELDASLREMAAAQWDDEPPAVDADVEASEPKKRGRSLECMMTHPLLPFWLVVSGKQNGKNGKPEMVTAYPTVQETRDLCKVVEDSMRMLTCYLEPAVFTQQDEPTQAWLAEAVYGVLMQADLLTALMDENGLAGVSETAEKPVEAGALKKNQPVVIDRDAADALQLLCEDGIQAVRLLLDYGCVQGMRAEEEPCGLATGSKQRLMQSVPEVLGYAALVRERLLTLEEQGLVKIREKDAWVYP